MLSELGHEVLVASPVSVLRGFADEPVRCAGVLPEVCDGLADLLQGEVLALPPDYDPFADEMIVEFAAGPHITAAVRALLPVAADLLVSHGGYHSIREAVRAGVPVAVLPVLHDQMHNARRVNELELGVRVQDFTPGAVASACRQAFTSTGIQHSVRRARRHLLGLPSIRAVAGYLERIVQRDRKLVSM
ncbi:UDP-glucoronosyl/UDP-glucosyl transferase [Lentzea atacamensis]|uniref:UDP-glucoronosyl/UDP-glucosyl transferase n=1 Tax=Lentzea atacamensis TaxID=531938 RepID=A0A316ID77_9PSEU|nr:nucleotide disphospho-sugar-binding domain-containing protein [Lentzea atacamensis]PWK85200.1 UDP-glucoronosyl/UDP-glucosyl transferase [Lentzea atacamensis]